MSLILTVPEDVSVTILNDWLDFEEWCCLDMAFCSYKCRTTLLKIFTFLKVSFDGGPAYYNWVYSRGMKLELFLKDESFDANLKLRYIVNLEKVVKVNVVYSNEDRIPSIVNIINVCPRLHSLECRCIKSHELLGAMTNLEHIIHLDIFDSEDLKRSLQILEDRCHKLQSLLLSDENGIDLEHLYGNIILSNQNLCFVRLPALVPIEFFEAHCPHIEQLSVYNSGLNMSQILSIIAKRPIKKIILFGFPEFEYENINGKVSLKIVNENKDIELDKWVSAIRSLYRVEFSCFTSIPKELIDFNYATLEHIDMDKLFIQKQTLHHILKSCILLKVFKFYGFFGPERGFAEIFEEVKPQHLQTFVMMNFEKFELYEVKSILKHCKSLQYCSVCTMSPLFEDVVVHMQYLNNEYQNGRELECEVFFANNESEDYEEICLRFVDGIFEGRNMEEYLRTGMANFTNNGVSNVEV